MLVLVGQPTHSLVITRKMHGTHKESEDYWIAVVMMSCIV